MSYVNLLPEDYLARQMQKRANLFCAVLFCVVMVAVLSAAVASERNHSQTRQVNERVNESYAEAGKLIRQLQDLEATKERMLKKANLTAGLLERVPRSHLLAAVTNALPQGASLKKFELSTKRHETTVVSKAGTSRYEVAAGKAKKVRTASRMEISLTVTGLAWTDVQVARFIAEMARCPLMETVDLVYSQEKEVQGTVAREFEVVMKLKTDADVRTAGEPGRAGLTRRTGQAGPAIGDAP